MTDTFPNKYPKSNQEHLASFSTIAFLYPAGVTVHYTATRGIVGTIKELATRNLGYHIIIGRDGTVYQCAEFNFRLNHAGKASWKGLSPNREHLAVSLESWGWVTQKPGGIFETWTGVNIPVGEVAERCGKHWDAATSQQELSLLSFLRWAVSQGIDPTNICGHDECAIPFGRKSDPGGVLSLPMPNLREILSDLYAS